MWGTHLLFSLLGSVFVLIPLAATGNWVLESRGLPSNFMPGQFVPGETTITLDKGAYLRLQMIDGSQMQFWGPGELFIPNQYLDKQLATSDPLTIAPLLLKSGHLRFSAKGENSHRWQIQTPKLIIKHFLETSSETVGQWEVLVNVFSWQGEIISEVCSLQGAVWVGIELLQVPSSPFVHLHAGEIFSSYLLYPGVKVEVGNSIQGLDPQVMEFLLGPSGENQLISPLLIP